LAERGRKGNAVFARLAEGVSGLGHRDDAFQVRSEYLKVPDINGEDPLRGPSARSLQM
jgi:hypothetical protein